MIRPSLPSRPPHIIPSTNHVKKKKLSYFPFCWHVGLKVVSITYTHSLSSSLSLTFSVTFILHLFLTILHWKDSWLFFFYLWKIKGNNHSIRENGLRANYKSSSICINGEKLNVNILRDNNKIERDVFFRPKILFWMF